MLRKIGSLQTSIFVVAINEEEKKRKKKETER